MSTITTPRTTLPLQKDDYSKKCHRVLRLHNCGHKTWVKRIVHVGCPHTPQSKKKCDNMASSARETSTNELCSRCRPKVKEMSPDPFDTLFKRAKADEKARESIQSIAHTAFVALKLAEGKIKESASAQKESGLEEEQLAKNANQDITENALPNTDELSKPAPRSILTSVWDLMTPGKSTPDDDSTQHSEFDPTNGWSDSDEEEKWESMRNEDNQLWKDREDDWVYIK